MSCKIFVLIILTTTALIADSAKSPFSEKYTEKITAAMTLKAKVKVDHPRKALVYHRAWGFNHRSIPTINKCLAIMAEKTGAFTVDFSRNVEDFSAESLKGYDLLIFNNTTKLQKGFKSSKQRNAILDFIKDGGGFMAIHAATDAGYPHWPEYSQLIGGVFDGHPWDSSGTFGICIEDPEHSCVDHYSNSTFKISDELYKYKEYHRKNQRVLMTVDTRVSPRRNGVPPKKNGKKNISPKKIGREDEDHALVWVKKYGKGHVFVSAFGHNESVCWDKGILQLWLNGIQFAAGDLEGETAALPQPDWQLKVIESTKKK